MKNNSYTVTSNQRAFTLAEILITLGIVGVVAALTIPTLILKYQKREYAARLSQTYSVLSNAVKLSQSDYGDISTWDYNTNKNLEGNTSVMRDIVSAYTEKYFLPHLRVSKNYGYVALSSAGYPKYKTKGGVVYLAAASNGYIVELSSGVTLFFWYNYTYVDGASSILRFTEPLIFVDVNGKAGPNVVGRDFYVFILSTSKNCLITYGDYFEYFSRTQFIEQCGSTTSNTANLYCAGLIKLDGWKIKDDYPW